MLSSTVDWRAGKNRDIPRPACRRAPLHLESCATPPHERDVDWCRWVGVKPYYPPPLPFQSSDLIKTGTFPLACYKTDSSPIHPLPQHRPHPPLNRHFPPLKSSSSLSVQQLQSQKNHRTLHSIVASVNRTQRAPTRNLATTPPFFIPSPGLLITVSFISSFYHFMPLSLFLICHPFPLGHSLK